VFQVILIVAGLGLVGLSVWLDTFVTSSIRWLWIAVAGFALMAAGTFTMKR